VLVEVAYPIKGMLPELQYLISALAVAVLEP
jgi:hypothetical protein